MLRKILLLCAFIFTFLFSFPFITSATVHGPILENPCCSNVLFIPGIEASRLYEDVPGKSGTTTKTLWEPRGNDEVKHLYLDSKGLSIEPAIYTGDIIDSAYGFKSPASGSVYGLKDIYRTFITFMDGLVSDKTINNWQALPYDWRKNVDDIVDDSVLQKIYNLASTSNSGKVLIVAHSNGGLVAKVLMRRLESLGQKDLIEHVVLVASPELGTPASVSAMLHGHNQSVAGGALLSDDTARSLSQNMPGAYGLLPSRKFFENNPLVIINNPFASDQLISTFDKMKAFLLEGPLARASSTDTGTPIKLNPYLVAMSDAWHSVFDAWDPVDVSKFESILGWGVDTPLGITYSRPVHCVQKVDGLCKLKYSVSNSDKGDGTVLTGSNNETPDATTYFNLKKLKNDQIIATQEFDHSNIMEAKVLQKKLKDIIIRSSPSNADYNRYFSHTEPVDDDTYVDLYIFSPVDIEVYDSKGRHLSSSENQIPGAGYYEYNDIKQVAFPYDPNGQIILKGNDAGTFIIKASLRKHDVMLASTTFAELPVTPLTNIDFVIASSTGNLDTFATSTKLIIDIDGDGVTDFVGHTNAYLDATNTDEVIQDFPAYLESIRKTILSLDLPSSIEKKELNRLDKIADFVQKKHPERNKKIDRFIQKISNPRFGKRLLTDSQKTAIFKIFDSLVTRLEKYITFY